MRLLMAVTLGAACSFGCTGTVAPLSGSGSAATSPAVITDGSEVSARIGKLVEVRGTAQNAKISAAVVAGDLVVYCLGVDGWPSTAAGKQVSARGTLEHTDEFAARVGPRGEVSAGTEGPVWVLRRCQYDLLQ